MTRLFSICVFVLAVSVTAPRADTHVPTIRLSSANLPPVSLPDHTGYLDRLLIELFGRVGYDVEFINLPPRRALMNANLGLHDGDAARIPELTDEFSNLLVVEPAIIDVEFVGIYTDPAINIDTVDDFSDYSVGYIRGWRLAEDLFKGQPNAIAVDGPDNLMVMLRENRIDVAFLTREPGQLYSDMNGIENALFTDFRIRRGLHIHLNDRFLDLVPELTAALLEMRSDGTYELLLPSGE